jgi:membrane-bound ClpP family serine protease
MSPLLALPAAVENLDPWAQVLGAIALLAVGAGLLIVEFFVISWGMLSVGAAICGVLACLVAFSASPMVGWIFVCACPVILAFLVPWGFRQMQRSSAVPHVEITEDAGYRHEAERLGIVPGAIGELVTDAIPTGRARFAGGDIDVTVEGGALTVGEPVVVLRIEGPIVAVAKAQPRA